ncbi:MAG: DinB family protein [Thermomicrobiales bacterium]
MVMTAIDTGRPAADEHIPYFGQYIALVPDGDIIEILATQITATTTLYGALSPEQERWRPAPREWNAREIAGHVNDTERLLLHRALRIARADPVLWESIDFELYVANAAFDKREMADLMGEFAAVRGATIALLRGLDETAWARRMPEEWSSRSVRSLAWLTAGHELHHVADICKLTA